MRGYCTVSQLVDDGLSIDETEIANFVIYDDVVRAQAAIRTATQQIETHTQNRFLPADEVFILPAPRRLLTRRIRRPRPLPSNFDFKVPSVKYRFGRSYEGYNWATLPVGKYEWFLDSGLLGPAGPFVSIEPAPFYRHAELQINATCGHILPLLDGNSIQSLSSSDQMQLAAGSNMFEIGAAIALFDANNAYEFAEIEAYEQVSGNNHQYGLARALAGTSKLAAPNLVKLTEPPESVNRACKKLAIKHYGSISMRENDDPAMAILPPVVDWDVQVLLKDYRLSGRVGSV